MSKNLSRSFSCSRSHKIYIRSNKIKLGSTYAYHALWPLSYDLNKVQDRDKSANRCNGGISIIKLYASFHHHMWIQTRVTVRIRLSWVLTSVTLTFDLWPWPFAWTSLLSLVITPENFMMIRWWEHGEKRCDGRTDRRTDRRTEPVI